MQVYSISSSILIFSQSEAWLRTKARADKNQCSMCNTTTNKYGRAQDQFIKAVCNEVDVHGAKCFHDKDWRAIAPANSGGRSSSLASPAKSSADSYYIKPLALWVPHLLFNHMPTCPPHCESCQRIQIEKPDWIPSPIPLFTLKGHQYLDMFLYYCGHCNWRFNRYHKKSMQLDASAYIGYFNFFLGVKGFAVDEGLHSYTVNAAAHQSTQSIYEKLSKCFRKKC